MTEQEARQVLLLQAREAAGPGPAWSADDAAWATAQAVQVLGEQAAPERFVATRAALAMPRLLARDRGARRWLDRRVWHPAWLVVAAGAAFALGLAADELGAPQRVNLLAPSVWAVVAWNLLVYLSLLLPMPTGTLRRWMARLGGGGDSHITPLWAERAAPLSLARAALVLHAAAAALALGLVAGLYLRGLVLDYRAGWQSTFLDAAAVQSLLGMLLAPARALTGIALPDIAPLRLLPGATASASAAPWIHLYATTLALFVVGPRLVLAAFAAWRAQALSRRFPLPLDGAYFEALHPLMRPDRDRVLRLLWLAPDAAAAPVLLGQVLAPLTAPLTLLRSDVGDLLELQPASQIAALVPPAGQRSLARRWADWTGGAVAPAARPRTEAVLFVAGAGATLPPALLALGQPVVWLWEGAAPAGPPPAPVCAVLPLRALADGWLPDGRLFTALQAALPGDTRLQRLAAAWTARQQTRFDAAMAELAAGLARSAAARVALADDSMLARRGAADSAQQALETQLQAEWRDGAARLASLLGAPATAAADAALASAPGALRGRIGEGRAALLGGAVTGALTGLKADLLAGGMTMGAGALAGGLIGALGAAGMARGLNVVRGTDRSFVACSDAALDALAAATLLRYVAFVSTAPQDTWASAVAAALTSQQAALAEVWRGRSRRFDNAGEAPQLASRLQPLLAAAVRDALARLHPVA